MLSIKDIIQFLEPIQIKIPIQSDELYLEKTLPSYVVSFLEKYVPEEHKFQTLPPIPRESFLVSFLYLSDPHFVPMREQPRLEAVTELRKTMGFQLDEKDLHKKFNYSRKRKFKKIDLQKRLFQVKKSLEEQYPEEPIKNPLYQYIVDFFSVNIFVLDVDKQKVEPILAGVDDQNAFKPTIFLFYEGKRFYPLVVKTGQHFILSQDSFLKKIYQKYTKVFDEKQPETTAQGTTIQTIAPDECSDECSDDEQEEQSEAEDQSEVEEQNEQESGAEEAEEQEDKSDTEVQEESVEEMGQAYFEKMSVADLRSFVTKKGLSIWKVSDKTGKNIFLKKAELIEILI